MPDPSLIIAISRQRGSGGAEVGRRLADRLALRYIDRELLRHAAEFLKAQDDRGEAAADSASWWSRLGEAMGIAAGGLSHVPPALQSLHEGELLGIEERVLHEIAEHGRVVVVGCGAAQVLKGRPGVTSIFLHAPLAWRIARVQQLYGLTEARAADAVRESDKNRARFIQQLTGAHWTDACHCDLTLDTSTIGVEACVEVVLGAVARTQAATS